MAQIGRIGRMSVAVITLLCISSVGVAQEIQEVTQPAPRSDLDLSASLGFVGGQFARITLHPNLGIGALALGLDLQLRMDPANGFALVDREGNPCVVPNPGENACTIYPWDLIALRSVEFNTTGIHASYAPLDRVTLDHGLITERYTALAQATDRLPLREKGIQVRLGMPGGFNLSGFAPLNLAGATDGANVFGGRVAFRIPIDVDLLIDFGATFASDATPGQTSVTMFGVDSSFLLAEGSLLAYAEWATQISQDTAPGTFTANSGLEAGFKSRLASGATFHTGFRSLGQGFVPALFDENYEGMKSARITTLANPGPGRTLAVFAELKQNLGLTADILVRYDLPLGGGNDQSLYVVYEGQLSDRLGAQVFFKQRPLDLLNFGTNSSLGIEFVYAIQGSSLEVVAGFEGWYDAAGGQFVQQSCAEIRAHF
ncbi:MAG: hypothetical protein ACE5JP_05080 [Candidatus Bipolaricaulia bacterium]